MASDPPETGVFVPVGAIFPGVAADAATLTALLRDLSRTDTLFWCARLNLIVSGHGPDDHKTRQQRALTRVCTPARIEAVNRFAARHGGADAVKVFFRGQLLELMRWTARHAVDHPGDGATFDDPAAVERFVKAALIASDLWAQRVFANRFTLEGGVDVARRRALGTIRKAIEEAGTAPELENSLGRGWTLFSEYFARRYPTFAEEFHATIALTPEEYYVCVAATVLHFVSSNTETPIFNWRQAAAATPFRDTFQRYVLSESQTADELASSLWNGDTLAGYRSLRERPILRTSDDRAIILDPVFYSERASVGPLFHLVGPNAASGKVNRIFGAFGEAFEDYAADILRRMYPEGSAPLARRLSLNVKGRDREGRQLEIDALLDDVTEVVIVETKAAWLREDEILADTYEAYLEHLRAKYGVAARVAEGDRPKGVAQLARILGTITTGGWTGSEHQFDRARLLYPVLLVHDPLLGVAVYGNFLATEFSRLFGAGEVTGELQKGDQRVAPLTVMTIGDLETLESSVGEFSLREFLADYSRDCPDRLRSLHNFVALSHYRNRMFRNENLTAKAADIIRRCKNALFPDAPPRDG